MPADDSFFNDINKEQLLWYYHNIMKDEEEELKNKRDIVEYLASFIEPEAVKEIVEKRREREGQEEQEKYNDEFKPMNKISSTNTVEDNLSSILSFADNFYANVRKEKDDTRYNYKYWLDFDLGS